MRQKEHVLSFEMISYSLRTQIIQYRRLPKFYCKAASNLSMIIQLSNSFSVPLYISAEINKNYLTICR